MHIDGHQRTVFFDVLTFYEGTPPFVAAFLSPPFRRGRFVASHFVAGNTVRRQLFRRGYSSSPAVLSRRHFVASHFVAGTMFAFIDNLP